uniref:BTB domain-containing protein n=1 Tax=Caenorhabditis tropicalis TaxID=1561998 RepID=A0A1I7UWQ3_9PELO
MDDYGIKYAEPDVMDSYGVMLSEQPVLGFVVYDNEGYVRPKNVSGMGIMAGLMITSPTLTLFLPAMTLFFIPYLDLKISFPGIISNAFTGYPGIECIIIIYMASFYNTALRSHYKSLDYTLEAPLSDKVFLQVMKFGSICYPFVIISIDLHRIIAKEIGLKLNLTRAFVTNPLENPLLQDLRSVILDLSGFYRGPEYKIGKREGKDILDINRILKTCLNENSRQNLIHLQLRNYEFFADNWIEELKETLPSLQSLKCESISKEECAMICRFYPNLVSLKINEAKIENLKEISQLKNLQILGMTYSSFESSDALKSLFDLPNLRLIKVTSSRNFFERLLHCDGTFRNLRFIECKESDITETQLKELVDRHPTLECIAVLETPCEIINFPNLQTKVLNLGNIKSTMDTLYYILHQTDWFSRSYDVNKCIQKIEQLLEHAVILKGFEEEEFLNLMMESVNFYQSYMKSEETSKIRKCLFLFLKRSFRGKSKEDILKSLDIQPKTSLLTKRRWAAQTVFEYYKDYPN